MNILAGNIPTGNILTNTVLPDHSSTESFLYSAMYRESDFPADKPLPLWDSIVSEYEHTCTFTLSTERPMCSTCISEEEERMMSSRKYSLGKMCICELQPGHAVYSCPICSGIQRDIRFFQSEIIRVCTSHAVEVSQTFFVNPNFQHSVELLAFRCRMLNEFLLQQRVKMSGIDEAKEIIIDITDELSVITPTTVFDHEDIASVVSDEENIETKYDYSLTFCRDDDDFPKPSTELTALDLQ